MFGLFNKSRGVKYSPFAKDAKEWAMCRTPCRRKTLVDKKIGVALCDTYTYYNIVAYVMEARPIRPIQ